MKNNARLEIRISQELKDKLKKKGVTSAQIREILEKLAS